MHLSIKDRGINTAIGLYIQAAYEISNRPETLEIMTSLVPFIKGALTQGEDLKNKMFHDLMDLLFYSGIWYAKTFPDRVKIAREKIDFKTVPVKSETYIG